MTRWSIAFPILSLIALTCAAQDVPPPPKPPDDGPSLADTMKFIEEKLGSIGPVSYVAYHHDNTDGRDWTVKIIQKESNVRASVQGCRIDYHMWSSFAGKVGLDQDAWFLLKDVEEVVVETKEQNFKKAASRQGVPEVSTRVDPPVFVITAKKKNGGDEFALNDEPLAHRIAKALVHAVELCGGGSKDPF
jgi:hypothetical protein